MRRRVVGQVFAQARYQNTLFWRTPVLVFFTFALPVMLFFLFELMFHDPVHTMNGTMSVAQFYGPSLASYGVISGTYSYLAINTAIQRDEGILKRIRGTPLPAWVYIAGRIGSALCVAGVAAIVTLGIAYLFYDLEIAFIAIPAILVTFVIGTAAFAALGLALSAFCPNGDAAPAVANATLLPLLFVSSVFLPLQEPGPVVKWIGDIFPVKPFSLAFQQAVHSTTLSGGFNWGRLAVVALWGVFGVVIALRFFQWEPNTRGTVRRARVARKAVTT